MRAHRCMFGGEIGTYTTQRNFGIWEILGERIVVKKLYGMQLGAIVLSHQCNSAIVVSRQCVKLQEHINEFSYK